MSVEKHISTEILYLMILNLSYLNYFLEMPQYPCESCFVGQVLYPGIIISSAICSFVLVVMCSKNQKILRMYTTINIAVNGIFSVYNYWLANMFVEVFTSNDVGVSWNEISDTAYGLMFLEFANVVLLLFSISNVRKWIKELREQQDKVSDQHKYATEPKIKREKFLAQKEKLLGEDGIPTVVPLTNVSHVDPSVPEMWSSIKVAPIHTV